MANLKKTEENQKIIKILRGLCRSSSSSVVKTLGSDKIMSILSNFSRLCFEILCSSKKFMKKLRKASENLKFSKSFPFCSRFSEAFAQEYSKFRRVSWWSCP